MHVLVIGATGLIGGSVVARLADAGHTVTGVARSTEGIRASRPEVDVRSLDIGRLSAADWSRLLVGVDAVVNAAGTLQDAPGSSTLRVHATGVAALVAAMEAAGIRRLVHLSAIGVDRETPTAFSSTKRRGEEVVAASSLDWVILRPSVVVGRSAFGGSALFRGLAALPVLPVMPGTGDLQVVQLDEVADSVVRMLHPGAPSRVAFDVAGPERLSLEEVVGSYRAWLGWRPARRLSLPAPLAGLLYRLGDLVGLLGWRPPMRTTARREILRGATGDPLPWMAATGIRPRSLAAALAAEPASVQERWFARLYWLKPLVFVVLSLFWIGTGLVSVGPGYRAGVDLMLAGGAGRWAGPAVIAGGLADLLVGVGIAVRRTARAALLAALAISVFYVLAGTVVLPALWLDPLGPLLKVFPIMVLNLVALAILEDR